jgi:hypothetical protein
VTPRWRRSARRHPHENEKSAQPISPQSRSDERTTIATPLTPETTGKQQIADSSMEAAKTDGAIGSRFPTQAAEQPLAESRRDLWSATRTGLSRVGGAPAPGKAGLLEGDRTRFALLGVVLLAVVAGVFGLCTLALAVGFGVPWPIAVAVAAVLAGVVACVNRYVIRRVNMPDRRINVSAALAGPAVALLVSGTIATSFCLVAFRPAIDLERREAVERQLDDHEKELQERSASLQHDVDDAARPRPDPILDDLRRQLTMKDEALARAKQDLLDEALGKHGTGVGRKARYREYQDHVNEVSQDRDKLFAKVDLQEAEANRAALARAEPAQARLDEVTKQLAEVGRQRAQQVASVRSDDTSGPAQVARIATLFSLLASLTVAPAFWIVFLACFLVQNLPVLLRMGCGPTMLDDQALRDAHNPEHNGYPTSLRSDLHQPAALKKQIARQQRDKQEGA